MEKKAKGGGIKIIADNKKGYFNYEILEKFEAGLVLTGSEVKAVRLGKVNLGDAYAMIKNDELFLFQLHITSYQGTHFSNHEPMRTRKLLLHKKEIAKLIGQTEEKGLSLIPLKMYFKDGFAKVELGLGRGKKMFDKRQIIKKKDNDREMRRALKVKNR